MARIEAAVHRITVAAAREPRIDGDLMARHEALRHAVTQSLHELDSLIGEPRP